MSKLYVDIPQLLTLAGVRKKQGRHITESDLGIIEKAAIAVDDGGLIAWVGPTSQIPDRYSQWTRQSRPGETWLPAPVECHTHLVFAGSRAREFGMRCGGLTYQQIAEQGGGILSTVKATREATLEKLTALASDRITQFEATGVGAIEIKSGYGLSLESELKMLEVVEKLRKTARARLVPTFLPAHAVPPEFKGRQDDYVKEITDHWIGEVSRRKLASYFDVFIEKGFFDLKQAETMIRAAKDAGLGIKLHVDQFNAFGGAELAAKLEAVSADHLDCVGDAGIAALAKSKTVAVLAPGASLFTGTPYPPARKLIDAGACVAVTTDFNPGTCPSTSLALMGTLASTQMKMTLPETVAALTYGAAAAIGLESEMGTLEAGMRFHAAVLPGPSYEGWAYGFGQAPTAYI